MSKEIDPQPKVQSPGWPQVYDSLKRDFPKELKPLLNALGRWHEESRHADIKTH